MTSVLPHPTDPGHVALPSYPELGVWYEDTDAGEINEVLLILISNPSTHPFQQHFADSSYPVKTNQGNWMTELIEFNVKSIISKVSYSATPTLYWCTCDDIIYYDSPKLNQA